MPGAGIQYVQFEGWLIKLVGRKKKADGWYPRLFQDPLFVEAVKAKWEEIKPGLDEIPDMIDRLSEGFLHYPRCLAGHGAAQAITPPFR